MTHLKIAILDSLLFLGESVDVHAMSELGTIKDNRGLLEVPAAGPSSPQPEPSFLFIGELAQETGLDPKTIRFYEREGLVAPPRHGRFRTYMPSDVKRLKDVVIMRKMGIGIAQIRAFLTAEGGLSEAGNESTVNLLLNHLEQLRQRQAELTRQMEATAAILNRCSNTES